MLVARDQLISYDIAEDLFFARRYGSGDPISRDQFFLLNPMRLTDGLYCAIGNDVDGWELEQFNSANWNTVLPDPRYSLIITNDGLNALTYVLQGGYQLYFSGIKVLSNTVLNPSKPIINWTNDDFVAAGKVQFSLGTADSKHRDENINRVLRYRYNTATGSLQFTFTMRNDDRLTAVSDRGEETFPIGAFGLYVKRGNQYTTSRSEDILFAVASLPDIVMKYADTEDRVGNSLRFHFNTVLSNLGYVANIDVVDEEDHSLPAVPNETLLQYPYNPIKRPHNCYVVENFYGTGTPALAVQRTTTTENMLKPDWVYFQPNDNVLTLPAGGNYFASNVKDYMFVYWDTTTSKYCLAQGEPETSLSQSGQDGNKEKDAEAKMHNKNSIMTNNPRMPIGMKVGNSIVFAGTVVNDTKREIYTYKVELANGGRGYRPGDELYLPVDEGLIFKILVTSTATDGSIDQGFRLIGPETGSIPLATSPMLVHAVYDSRSNLKYGRDAVFKLKYTKDNKPFVWPFTDSSNLAGWLNKPLYCGYGANAGKPTTEKTDSFLGWCVGNNSIQLALDLRNEASEGTYGTTRYATDCETRDSWKYIQASHQTTLTPWTACNNYLQITKPELDTQPGKLLTNPIEVKTFTHFNEILIGKGVSSPYTNSQHPYIENDDISFYGMAFRAWYKDIAEYYRADEYYIPGTLITFGKGKAEISVAETECDGIISNKPGYQLGNKTSDLDLPVALVGRVPVLFDGNCFPHFGDKVYLSKIKKGCASTVENGKCLGKIIDKDISNSNLIECVVRIDF